MSLVSQPDGAKVFDGDTELGVTPLTKRLKKGDTTMRLELRRSGYQNKTVELVPSKDQVLSVRLKSSKRRTSKPKKATPSKPAAAAPKPKPRPKPKPKAKPKSLRHDLLD